MSGKDPPDEATALIDHQPDLEEVRHHVQSIEIKLQLISGVPGPSKAATASQS
jgi:hypothetical protein